MNHDHFEKLAGHSPFPWQEAFYKRFIDDNFGDDFPRAVCIPTGLGKTSVIALWLLAMMNRPDHIPRRLVYVVNRRTVVDQTTVEVEHLRENLPKLGNPDFQTLAISTLRGQFADNREWSADPSQPAVICGTVDMIGSRLLFSGYGVGFKAKPLHAGFLGQDVLLVHDEAHLEPAFQMLLTAIETEQRRCNEFASFRVMELTATTRHDHHDGAKPSKPFTLTKEELNPPPVLPNPPAEPLHHVWRRLRAAKRLVLHEAGDDTGAAAKMIANLAEGHKNDQVAVLVFVRTLNDVETVHRELSKTEREIVLLTGTMRGKERDELVKKPIFKRFLKDASPGETVYLICTSAGEVGIDISADHMVCDLSTFDSMAQRLGRVNRYGERADTCIDVVHPTTFGRTDKKTGELKADEIDKRRQKTLELLRKLPSLGKNQYDASPLALSNLHADERRVAFAPGPITLPVTDILFDAWVLTSIRDKMPGRPPVEPYLHGIRDWEPPRTNVAWREEVDVIDTDEPCQRGQLEDLLEEYPLKPHELLNDTSERVHAELQVMAERLDNDCRVWLVGEHGEIEVISLRTLLDSDKKRVIEHIADGTILLPPSIGGLCDGMLSGESEHANDVADMTDGIVERRIRIMSDDQAYDAKTKGMRLVRSIELNPDEEDATQPLTWDWYKLKPLEGGRTASQPVLLSIHAGDVECEAARIVAGILLPEEVAQAIRVAARLHDHGKRRVSFQATLGNRAYPASVLAKSGRAAVRLPETYRHEFGSLTDAAEDAEFKGLSPQMRDLVLHMIAAHHGRARPHFPMDEAYDPDHPTTITDQVACEVPRRFARLQRQYGRWGLAYLESLLRAADWAASAEPSAYEDQTKEVTP